MITLPLVLRYMEERYNINQSELVILLIINNTNRNNIKIMVSDIRDITGYTYQWTNKLLHILKNKGYITLNRDYKLTRQGQSLLHYYTYILSSQIKELNSNTLISFADYSSAATKKAAYKYRVKKGIIKDPSKSKYYNKG